ncbi:MAG TPA: twin-arginine translocase subunit TatC [Alphaproteobacteria bacterium]|nr:twin-arginine translocase subunit TatC [Alphaproteobacteria bacterium]
MSTETPLMHHLIELRTRLVWSVGVLGVAFIVCYFFSKEIYGFLVAPLAHALEQKGGQHQMIYTQLSEAFFTYLSVALWAAFFITSPFILMQIWKFVAPGLYGHERRMLLPYLVATPMLFLAGAALAYYMVFPAAWSFFLSFETPSGPGGVPIQLEARVGDYLNLSMSLILAFGFSFELPLALVLLVHAGMLKVADLIRFRRYAIVIAFVAAAIFTPPDVLSQLSLAVPLCVLYELAIIAARFVEKAKAAEERPLDA